jgi:hypothetical protein
VRAELLEEALHGGGVDDVVDQESLIGVGEEITSTDVLGEDDAEERRPFQVATQDFDDDELLHVQGCLDDHAVPEGGAFNTAGRS